MLNAIYFMKTVIRIYTPVRKCRYASIPLSSNWPYAGAMVCFIALNIVLGMCSQPILDLVTQGLEMFS